MKLVGLLFKEESQAALLSGYGQGGGTTWYQTATIEPEMALAVLKEIDKKAKEAGVELEDLVMIFKDKNGEPKIKQTKDTTAGQGAKRGSFWGLLAGLLLGGPLAGILGGLALGAIYGKSVDRGLPDKFIKNMGSALQRGQSAVLVVVKPEDYDRSVAFLKTFDAELYEAEISDEAEEAVMKMAKHEAVQQTIKTEFDVEE